MTRAVLWQPVPTADGHAAFPGICLLPTGDLLACWRESDRHTGGTPSEIAVAVSSDGGRTWERRGQVVSLGDERDPSLTCSADGDIVRLSSFRYAPDGTCTILVRASLDDGHSWLSPATIGTGAVSAPVVELPDSSLILPTYGRTNTTDAYDSCRVWRRLPDDDTWTPAPSLLGSGTLAGRHLQEPYVIRLRTSGALLAAMRYGNWDRIAMCASWDDGATWSTPVPKFAGTGRPMLVELATGPTVCLYRNPTTRAAVWRESPDRGGAWGPEQLLLAAPAQMTYGAVVEVTPGTAAGIVGIESSDTLSRLQSFYLLA